jgi:hypothetical protein
MRNRSTPGLASALALLLAVLVGCSGGGSPKPTPTPAPSTSAPGVFHKKAMVDTFFDSTGDDPTAKINQGIAALEHADQVTDVHPTEVECTTLPGGHVDLHDRPVPELEPLAKKRDLRVAPRVGCQSYDLIEQILFDSKRLPGSTPHPAARQKWIDRAIAIGNTHAGVVIDFEITRPFETAQQAAQFRDALVSFEREIDAGLKHKHYLMTAVVPRTSDSPTARSAFYDQHELPGRIFLMAWRTYFDAAEDEGGELNPLSYVRTVLEHVRSEGVPNQTVLGMPLYALDWCGREATPRLTSEVEALHARPDIARGIVRPGDAQLLHYRDADGCVRDVYVNDADSVRVRAGLAAKAGLLGVGFWRVGQESPPFWEQLGPVGPRL